MITPEKAAAVLIAIADAWRSMGKRCFGPNSLDPDKSMVKCYSNDSRQIKGLAKVILKKNGYAAYNRAWHLDTILREQIPDTIWEYLDQFET